MSAIISLNENWEVFLDPKTLAAAHIEVLSLPTPDYSNPSLDDIHKAIEFISSQVKRSLVLHLDRIFVFYAFFVSRFFYK